MLKVLPIQSKAEQEAICQKCGVTFNPDLLAYVATVDDRLAGVCQFKLTADGGILYDLAAATDFYNFESLFVMGRGTLNFIQSDNGKYCYHDHTNHGFWRVYHYVSGAKAYDSADKPGLLFGAAKAFGKFQRQLEDFPAETLFETIPNFHHTVKRYEAFEAAVDADVIGRAASVKDEIEALRRLRSYASIIVDGLADGSIPTRVTHNDTKLNNILFDEQTDKPICVIDLDTIMPGSLLYDFGDAIRFAANNTVEDDTDLDRVYLRMDRYEEYVSGFLAGVKDTITERELALLPESALIMTYEVALRFMTDYLDGDLYFKIHYPDQNLVRARDQLRLSEDIASKLDEMRAVAEKYVK